MPTLVPFRSVFTAPLLACALFGATPAVSLAAEHTLMPSPQTVHIGHFSSA